jgi:hypothetical protein
LLPRYAEEFNVQYKFIIGAKSSKEADPTARDAELLAEQEKYGDLVILPDVDDQYLKLSEKMANMFKWAWKDAPAQYKYLMKGTGDGNLICFLLR